MKIKLEEIDLQIKEVITKLNKIPFIQTIDSCQGHIYKNKRLKGYRYTEGYIAGHFKDKQKGEIFLKDISCFIEDHNKNSLTEFDSLGTSPLLFIVLNASKKKDPNYRIISRNLVFYSLDKKVLENRDIIMSKSWNGLENFIDDYRSKS